MKLQPGLIFLAVTIFSIIIYLFFISPESRTNYPTWTQTSDNAWEPANAAAADAAGASTTQTYANARAAELWAGTASGSNVKLPWAGDTDTKDLSQLELTKRWINRTVTTGITQDSITSSGTGGIKSILVRKNDGLTAELPIMEFFKKLHDDMHLGYLRAKDYTDGIRADIMADPTIVKYDTGFKFRNAVNNFGVGGGNWIAEGGWVVKMMPGGGAGDNWKITRT